jgi:flagellar protein FliL
MASKTDAEEKEGKDAAKEAKGGSKVKLIIMVLPTVLLIVGAVYFLFLKPSAPATPAPEPPPVPGAVVKLEPISINLAGGHYLKLGFSLQATASAGEEVAGAKALDKAIALYSGKTIQELSSKDGRERTKKELIAQVKEAYEKKVYDVYFTEYVMQ